MDRGKTPGVRASDQAPAVHLVHHAPWPVQRAGADFLQGGVAERRGHGLVRRGAAGRELAQLLLAALGPGAREGGGLLALGVAGLAELLHGPGGRLVRLAVALLAAHVRGLGELRLGHREHGGRLELRPALQEALRERAGLLRQPQRLLRVVVLELRLGRHLQGDALALLGVHLLEESERHAAGRHRLGGLVLGRVRRCGGELPVGLTLLVPQPSEVRGRPLRNLQGLVRPLLHQVQPRGGAQHLRLAPGVLQLPQQRHRLLGPA
mmetsp:Transcript_92037/g.297915  ORF Transcript_92037/g.297915 Transcript_92037/m.297915 type:complete len:265 (+) Transcript_92037:116-910(+)